MSKTRKTKKTRPSRKKTFDTDSINVAKPSVPATNLTTVGETIAKHLQRLSTTRQVKIVKQPANCWEHFKQDCFPIWAQLRWPVQYSEQRFWEWMVVEIDNDKANG